MTGPSDPNGSDCVTIAFSHSRDGTCDLGNDEVNIEKIVSNSSLTVEDMWINSGCENDTLARRSFFAAVEESDEHWLSLLSKYFF